MASTQHRSLLSRRRFLRAAGLAAIAQLVAACGMGNQLGQITPTPTLPPTWTPTNRPSATPTASHTPTATHTPTA
ncbi:MAG: hypothetical protein ACP5JJ_05740, partial [Anaerolineae bacterium]